MKDILIQPLNVLLLNKPQKITSYQYLNKTRKLLGMKKAGHSGILDKMAEGLLLACFDKTTKLLKFFTNSDKQYFAEFIFGITTDTDDIWGKIIGKSDQKVTLAMIKNQLRHFSGEIEQLPPKFSRIQIQGKRAYKMALANQDFLLQTRKIHIYEINVCDFQDQILSVRISCSKGTYIRAIARDLGKMCGPGAVVSHLIREKIGDFELKDACNHQKITENNYSWISVDKILPDFKTIEIRPDFISSLMNGKTINDDFFVRKPDEDGYYKIMYKEQLILVMKKFQNKYSYEVSFL